jgi:hypothetical protein
MPVERESLRRKLTGVMVQKVYLVPDQFDGRHLF